MSVVGVFVAGCQLAPPPDTARPATAAFGSNGDNDVSAINISSWAFSRPSNTLGRPIDAARAVAAVDYLAGELSTSPRWDFMSPITKIQMLQARVEVRQAVGIAPNAPSQQVITALLGVAVALDAHDQPAALRDLASPVFTRPPAQILATLGSMPYLQRANIATQNASQQEQPADFGG